MKRVWFVSAVASIFILGLAGSALALDSPYWYRNPAGGWQGDDHPWGGEQNNDEPQIEFDPQFAPGPAWTGHVGMDLLLNKITRSVFKRLEENRMVNRVSSPNNGNKDDNSKANDNTVDPQQNYTKGN
jgi:hypothetical protein